MGCLKPVQLWWEVRRETRRARKRAKEAAKAAVRREAAAKIDVDSIPVNAMAPTQRKFTSGGFAMSFELAPAKTLNVPGMSPTPMYDEQRAAIDMLDGSRKVYDFRHHLGPFGFASESDVHVSNGHRDNQSYRPYLDAANAGSPSSDIVDNLTENLATLEARCRHSRRMQRFINLFKSRSSDTANHVPNPAATRNAAATAYVSATVHGDEGMSGNGAHFGGSPSQ